jgi:adenine-specific DNA-methyltransferase
MRSELESMGIPFQYPKPKELLQYLLQIGCEKGGTILDFFSGSGSTAHAAWLQQAADGVSRRFILVQLPEPLDPTNEKQRPAIQFCDQLPEPTSFEKYPSLADLTKERLRRCWEEDSMRRTRNVRRRPRLPRLQARLQQHPRVGAEPRRPASNAGRRLIDHLKSDRSEQDILFELLLKLGLDLTVPMEQKTIAERPCIASARAR